MLEGLIGLYLLYFAGVWVLLRLGPILFLAAFEGLWLLGASVAWFLGRIGGMSIRLCGQLLRGLWYGAGILWCFVAAVVTEFLESAGWKRREESFEFDEDVFEGEEEDDAEDLFAQACARLDLPACFSKAEFVKAYRKVMQEAHPDRGGSDEEAQEVNAAREMIELHMGWAS